MKAKTLGLSFAALAVAVTPVAASGVAQSANTTVNATVNPVITISAAALTTLQVTPTASPALSSLSHVVTVNSNNSAGFDLTLSNADATGTLASGGNTIAASANTYASPAALASNTWGYAVAALGTFDASYAAENSAASSTTKWAGVPLLASPQNIKTTAAVAVNNQTTVWYAVEVDNTKPTGTYTDTVTYTATTK